MTIERQRRTAGEAPPEASFTGDVRVGGYYRRDAPSRLAGATVSFAPGARTPWKTSPRGQTIIILHGRGRIGSDGGVADVAAIPTRSACASGCAAGSK